MVDTDIDPAVVKARIVDNMNTAQEYSTEMVAQQVGLTAEEAEQYLEELARENRIRKRDGETGPRWVLFQ